MNAHHLFKERHQLHTCPYCSHDLTDHPWESVWHIEKHYKQAVCECGRELLISMQFHGSGHDSWEGKRNIALESANANSKGTVKTIENKLDIAESKTFILKGEVKK